MNLIKINFIKKTKALLTAPFLKSGLALFFLAALLVFSWIYLSDPNKISREEEQTHSLLKSKFKEILSELIEKKHPEVKRIAFNRLWTKKTEDSSKVEIYFNYSLILEEGGETELEGSALLSLSEDAVWQVQNFKIEKSYLDFSDPILIKKE